MGRNQACLSKQAIAALKFPRNSRRLTHAPKGSGATIVAPPQRSEEGVRIINVEFGFRGQRYIGRGSDVGQAPQGTSDELGRAKPKKAMFASQKAKVVSPTDMLNFQTWNMSAPETPGL
jgi:hypothetical protein